jgi:recombinational DNA repair ATPase RecF
MAKKSSGTATPAEATPAARLILSRISTRGVLGIEDHTIDLGPGVNVIVGANASGKSSHVQAIRSLLGMDRTSLVRLAHVKDDGTLEAKPEIEGVLVEADGSADYEARVRKAGASSAEVKERNGEDWRTEGRAVEWLRDVIDITGAQPALFLAASDAERQEAILETLDLPYERDAALEAADLAGFNVGHIPDGLHPLEELELIEKAVRDSRAIEGSKRREALDAAKRIEDGLPADRPKPVGDELVEADRKIEELAGEVGRIQGAAADGERSAVRAAETALETKDRELETALVTLERDLNATHDSKVADLRAAFDKRVRELEEEVRTAVDQATTKAKADLDEARKARDKAVTAAAEERRQAEAAAASKATELADWRTKAATLHERKTKIDSDAYFRKQIAETKADADRHSARWDKLSQSIDALVRYKLHLVESNPIKGLSIAVDDAGKFRLLLDGVPLSQTNTGRLEELAVEVSLLRAAPPASGRPHLPIILLDGIEALDPARRSALLKAVAARGVQVIAACVGDGPLRVLRGDEALA